MKIVKNFESFLNENENENDNKTLDEVLLSDDFDKFDILKYLKLGKLNKDFEFYKDINYDNREIIENIDDNNLLMVININYLEKLLDLDQGILQHLLDINAYYDYNSYYIDDDELNYINEYLDDKEINKLKELSELFKYKSDFNKHGEIREFLEYLTLDNLLLDLKSEISTIHERAIKESIKKAIDDLPFLIEYVSNGCSYNNKNFNLYIEVDYNKLCEYIKSKNIEVYTFLDVLEYVFSDSIFSFNEMEDDKYDYINYDTFKKSFNYEIDYLLQETDSIFPNLIKYNKLDIFKNAIEHSNFYETYRLDVRNYYDNYNLFQISEIFDNDITKWLRSKEFENYIIKNGTHYERKEYEKFMIREIDKYNL